MKKRLSENNTISRYEGRFTIVGNTVVVEEKFVFVSSQTSFSWYLPQDAEAVEIFGSGSKVKLIEDNLGRKVLVSGNFVNFTLKYLTDSLIEKTKDRFFLVDLSKVTASQISVIVTLPEGATLTYSLNALKNSLQTSFVPKTSKITTDGKSIVLQWDEKDLQQGKAILVRYQVPRKFISVETLILVLVILLIFVAVFFFSHRREKSKVKVKKEETREETEKNKNGDETVTVLKEISSDKLTFQSPKNSLKEKLTRNLFEEERAIMESLLDADHHELWQKQLSLKTGISAVKLSRKLRNLEAKGLIEKIPYGNTNKVRIKLSQTI
ncbi:hypothetical protein HYX13_03110 [Candidatus Woesearchaeota archaeon]|nr:hypothetical protein [Candidatus Woesearchaeota archaeon]